MAAPIEILLADDHPVILNGISMMLEDVPTIQLRHKVQNGQELKTALQRTPVAVALLDINMGEESGLDLCRWINREHPQVKVIAFTMYDEAAMVDAMIRAGAYGYLLKEAEKEEIIEAIQVVHAGGLYFKGKIGQFLKGIRKESPIDQPAPQISRREKEVLHYIMQELTNPEIAEKLAISPATVKSHRKSLLRKLEVKNSVGIVRKAMQLGLV
jgi:DNA-binding NarL/FixJ family response regulator